MRDDISTPVGQIYHVGLSTILQVDPVEGQNGLMIKGITFGNLWIGGATLSWGIGYPYTVGSETIFYNGMAPFYLCASGMTAIVGIFRGRSTGFEEQ